MCFFKEDFKDQCQMLSLKSIWSYTGTIHKRILSEYHITYSDAVHKLAWILLCLECNHHQKNIYCQRASELSREQTSACFCFGQSEQIIEFNSSFLLSFSFSHFSCLDTRYYWVWHISTNMAVFFASISQLFHVNVATLCGLTSEGNHAFYWTASSG